MIAVWRQGTRKSSRFAPAFLPLLFVSVFLLSSACGSAKTESSTTPASAAVPSGVTVSPGDGSVAISWNPVSGASSYNVYYGTSSGVTTATGTKVANATSPLAITGLNNGGAYYFIVTAVVAFGESNPSSEVSATPIVTPVPGVAATAADGSVAIAWTAVTGATSYNIYYSTSSGVTIATGTKVANATSSQAVTGLTNGTAYYFIVTSVGVGGESGPSSQVSATPTIASPTGLAATTSANGSVSLSWTAVTGATSYNIYYSTSSGVTIATGTKVANATSPKSITGLTAAAPYYFIMATVGTGGEGSASAAVSATPNTQTTLASSLTYPEHLAIDGTNIYWVEGGAAGKVKKVALGGGAVTTLATGNYPVTVASSINPFALALDATNVYWTDTNAGIVAKVPIAGGAVTELATVQNNPAYLAVNGTTVYYGELGTYVTADGIRKNDGKIKSIAAAGGAVSTLASNLAGPQTMAVDGTNVYWTEVANFIAGAGSVKLVPKAGGTVVSLVTGLSGSQNIALDATNLYYWAGYGALSKVALATQAATAVVTGMASTLAMVSDGTYVYWLESGSPGAVKKVNISTGTASTVASGFTNPLDIAVDSTSVYVLQGSGFDGTAWKADGSIIKVAK